MAADHFTIQTNPFARQYSNSFTDSHLLDWTDLFLTIPNNINLQRAQFFQIT